MKELPEVCITLQNATDELSKLLHVIKPSWNKNKVEMKEETLRFIQNICLKNLGDEVNNENKKLSGGHSCLMYYCFDKENPTDGVTVRAKNNTNQDMAPMQDTEFEVKVIRTMHQHGLFPKVLAAFKNGFCYQYISGKPVHSFGMESFSLEEATMRLMARKLAEINSVRVEGFDYSAPTYFQNMYTLLKEKYPSDDKLPSSLPKREDFYKELKLIEEHALRTGSPIVHCHGDPHPGNIVYDKDTDSLTYVDWELSHVGYQAGDVGAALQVLEAIKMELPDNFSKKYVRYYLEKCFEIQGRQASEVTDDDVDKFEAQANIFRLSILLLWVLLMVAMFTVNATDHLDVDTIKRLQSSIRQQSSESDTATSPSAKEEVGMQIVISVYQTYLGMKDEILGSRKKQ